MEGLSRLERLKSISAPNSQPKQKLCRCNHGAHTNTIEGSWFHLKRSLGLNGTRKSMHKGYFHMFLWRRVYANQPNPFKLFLQQIGLVFNPNEETAFQYEQTQDQ
jgi:hypothetical protein